MMAVWKGKDDVDDVYTGGAGNDSLYGYGGHDRLDGGKGNDYIEGGDGNDSLLGSAGSDTISGGGGNNTLTGGAGKDYFGVGAGYDIVTDYGAGDVLAIEERGSGEARRITKTAIDGKDYVFTVKDTWKKGTKSSNNTVRLQKAAGKTLEFIRLDWDERVRGIASYTMSKTALTVKADFGGSAVSKEWGDEWRTLDAENFLSTIKTVNAAAAKKATILYGNANANTITGGSAGDTIYGRKGNDILKGNKGDDYLDGGEGNDNLDGGVGADKLFGGSENDTLKGGAGRDTLYGGAGKDLLDGGADNDQLFGDAGEDKLLGGAGNDILDGGDDNDNLDGGAGNDSLVGGTGSDVLKGGAGDDTLAGGKGSDSLTGGAGKDVFVYDGGVNLITDYEQGKDVIRFSSTTLKDCQVSGNNVLMKLADGGQITVKGAAKKNITYIDKSGNRKNVQNGIWGDGVIIGGSGSEKLPGTKGEDKIYGQAGNDTISGLAGDDYLDGGAGNDWLSGGAGNDTLKGGAGNDTFVYKLGDGDDVITDYTAGDWLYLPDAGITGVEFTGNKCVLRIGDDDEPQGSITLQNFTSKAQVKIKNPYGIYTGTKDSVVLTALYGKGPGDMHMSSTQKTMDLSKAVKGVKMYGNAIANVMKGGKGNDTLDGGAGNDTLDGGVGNDSLHGGTGNDLLKGGAGNDVLDGGLGSDTLTGGAGNDIFDFGYKEANDLITDYEQGKDTVRFTDTTLKSSKVSGSNLVLALADGGQITVKGAAKKTITYIDANGKNTVKGNTSGGGSSGGGTSKGIVKKGDSGNNKLTGGAGNDSIYGYAGNDFLSGLAGNDYLDGGAGYDTLVGGDGDDWLFDNAGGDFMTGGAGNDTFAYNDDGAAEKGGGMLVTDYEAGDLLYNTKGFIRGIYTVDGDPNFDGVIEDVIDGKKFVYKVGKNDIVFGGDDVRAVILQNARGKAITFQDAKGIFTMQGTTLTLTSGTVGADELEVAVPSIKTIDLSKATKGFELDNTIRNAAFTGKGGAYNDTLYGGKGNDTLYGGKGNDKLGGNEGNDSLFGGAGNDTMYGDNDEPDLGNDYLDGGDGTDEMYGGTGNDSLYGGKGDDNMTGGEADDKLYGGAGNDWMCGDYFVQDAKGDWVIASKGGNDYLDGGDGDDNMLGGAGNDTLIGGSGNDYLGGYKGNNYLDGGTGDDFVGYGDGGNNGNDTLIGGSGNNTMVGGDGNDVFRCGSADGISHDSIWDYETGEVIEFMNNLTFVSAKDTKGNDNIGLTLITLSNGSTIDVIKKNSITCKQRGQLYTLTWNGNSYGWTRAGDSSFMMASSSPMVGSESAQLASLVSQTRTESLGAITGAGSGLTPVEPANGAVVAANPLTSTKIA